MTRFYLPSSGTPAVTPAYYTSVWDDTTSAFRAPLVTTKTGTAFDSTGINEAVNTRRQFLRAQYISEPLAATTLTGTFGVVVRGAESSANANAATYLVVRVLSQDGTTERGVAINTLAGNEYPNASAANALARYGSGSVTSTTVQEGDRLVVELGVDFNNINTTFYTAYMHLGDNSALDLVGTDGTQVIASNPWIEFSQTLTFYTPPIADTVTRDWNGNIVAIKRSTDA